MNNHFTENDLSLIKALAKSVGIPNLNIEIEGWDSEEDALIIEHGEYINFYPANEPYQTGHIVSFPGSFYEPPDDDYLDRMRYHTFADAAQDIILHIVTEKLSMTSEIFYGSSSDLPGSPVKGFDDKNIVGYGLAEMDA